MPLHSLLSFFHNRLLGSLACCFFIFSSTVFSRELTLRWTDDTSHEKGFQIERATLDEPYAFIANAAHDKVEFTDFIEDHSIEYWYRICSFHSNGNVKSVTFLHKPEDQTVATQVSGNYSKIQSYADWSMHLLALAAEMHTETLKLNWSDNSENEDGFQIECSIDNEHFEIIGNVPANTTSFEDIITDNRIARWYRVCAYNSAGKSGYTNIFHHLEKPDIQESTPSIELYSAATLTVASNEAFAYQIVAAAPSTSYSATNLPAGLTISGNTISGTPTQAGAFSVTLQAANQAGGSSTVTLTIRVSANAELIDQTVAIDTQINLLTSPTISDNTISETSTNEKVSGINLQLLNDVERSSITKQVISSEPSLIQQPTPKYRSATCSTANISGKRYVCIHFEQSTADIAAYDYVIEVSSDLKTWTSTPLEQLVERVKVIDNRNGSKSITVRYPQSFDANEPQYIRYGVSAKQ